MTLWLRVLGVCAWNKMHAVSTGTFLVCCELTIFFRILECVFCAVRHVGTTFLSSCTDSLRSSFTWGLTSNPSPAQSSSPWTTPIQLLDTSVKTNYTSHTRCDSSPHSDHSPHQQTVLVTRGHCLLAGPDFAAHTQKLEVHLHLFSY